VLAAFGTSNFFKAPHDEAPDDERCVDESLEDYVLSLAPKEAS
jgi:hypothetical protein